jgi:F0F1-type ATP synthase alpha subunit
MQEQEDNKADEDDSDGIARVHGMNNVQAEELVEYAYQKNPALRQEANGYAGSPPVSRACA